MAGSCNLLADKVNERGKQINLVEKRKSANDAFKSTYQIANFCGAK